GAGGALLRSAGGRTRLVSTAAHTPLTPTLSPRSGGRGSKTVRPKLCTEEQPPRERHEHGNKDVRLRADRVGGKFAERGQERPARHAISAAETTGDRPGHREHHTRRSDCRPDPHGPSRG